METKTKVYLAGEEFQLTSSDMSEEYLQKIAVSVNRRIDDIRTAYPTFEFQRAVLFAAFELAGELSALQSRYDALDKTVKQLHTPGGAVPAKRSYNAKKTAPVSKED